MESQKSYFIYFAAASVNLLSFATGSAYSWPSPVLPKLNGNVDSDSNPLPRPVTLIEESWISALINIGALVGPFMAGFMSDRVGRKKTILFFSLPMIISHLMCAFAKSVEIFLTARFILGLGIGCTFSILPYYVGEISESKNRGLLGCFLSLLGGIGTLFNYVVGPFVSIKILSFLNIIPLIIMLVTFGFYVPESPYYLMSTNDYQGAEDSLKKLRGKSKKEVENELMLIQQSVQSNMNSSGSFFDIFKSRSAMKGLKIVCGLMVFQQFSGINAVLAYTQTIFDEAGSVIPAEYSAILVGLIQILGVVVTSQLNDRLGRRILLLTSAVSGCLSLTALGFYFQFKKEMSSISWLPVASVLMYVFAFNLGLSPVTWTMMGELFPANFKSFACTICSFTCMLLGFFVSMFFPLLMASIGMALSFWMCAFVCGVCVVFTIFMVPETKGKSFVEIERILNNEVGKK